MEQTDLSQFKEINKLALHCCCAPCSCEIIERLASSNIDFTVFFYNPNIYPKLEYEKRKQEVIKLIKDLNISFIDSDYDLNTWLEKTTGLENEPERGKRCDICFELRLNKTAKFAKENSFDAFATSLGVSRWKDLDQVNSAGKKAAQRIENVKYLDLNWRKKGGEERRKEILKQSSMYIQQYCGCIYSLQNSEYFKNI